jgi:chromosome condensin MukBEF complex kleisin-like MukF subunit
VIVRLMGEGQYRIDDSVREKLNALDDEAMAALEANDEERLDAKLQEMWDVVQSEGDALPPDELSPSDVLIPPADLTLDETRELFQDEGLIPDLPG